MTAALEPSLDSFRCRRTLKADGAEYDYFSLKEAEANGLAGIASLPFSLKVLLENLLRHEDGRTVTADDIRAVALWLKKKSSDREIAFRPARVLMQDFTGVPAVVDLAAMRDAMGALGGDPRAINPLAPVDLVIDHSVMVDAFGSNSAFQINVDKEYERNRARYAFLRWGAAAFDNFRVVPPGTGICHQVNLEYLAQTVWTKENGGASVAFPDTLVGTDSHTTMVNGLSVLGWGVGGIEAEAAMLGQPISMLIPEVVGFRLTGELKDGVTATDLVLTVTEMLRLAGVVGKFVEFFGSGLAHLPLEDRATIANMAPEYGATCGFFPVDEETLAYLAATARSRERIALVESYAKAQGLYRDGDTPDPAFTKTLHLDLGDVEPSIAGPKRPQDRVPLARAASAFAEALDKEYGKGDEASLRVPVKGKNFDLGHGDVVIAAITSCTNTSNPSVMIAAGLLAKNAVERGLRVKPWVKTSLAPGSQVVTDYLAEAGLTKPLDALGFNLVGYGCTTCIGNSGPLPEEISHAVHTHHLAVAAVLSGNRNFEGRVNHDVRANYLASPPLVVAYALAGSVAVDLTKDPLGTGADGAPVYLKDIWPKAKEIAEVVRKAVKTSMFEKRYGDVFRGDPEWRAIEMKGGLTYDWDAELDLCAEPALFRRHGACARAGDRHQGRAHSRPLSRFDHDRPHLARGRDQARQPRRPLPDRARRRRSRFQFLRRAARQSRSDGARHLRQYQDQEPDGARGRGRRHDPLSVGRAPRDLRRRHALPRRGCAARRFRRKGIWHRVLARLGGEGHASARRPRRDRRELRAHPSLQSDRHGCVAASFRRRRELALARPQGR